MNVIRSTGSNWLKTGPGSFQTAALAKSPTNTRIPQVLRIETIHGRKDQTQKRSGHVSKTQRKEAFQETGKDKYVSPFPLSFHKDIDVWKKFL